MSRTVILQNVKIPPSMSSDTSYLCVISRKSIHGILVNMLVMDGWTDIRKRKSNNPPSGVNRWWMIMDRRGHFPNTNLLCK